MNTNDERNIDPVVEMSRIAKSVLDLGSWGFKESYQSAQARKIIFDSERCRLNLIWGGWDYSAGNTIHILYGRLHAPNEKETMIWNGEECHCWHDIDHPLNFLDGLQPADVIKRYYSHRITSSFFTDESRQKFQRRQPEWMGEMHLTIWNYYGNRFFELFDLRRSDLWEQYRHFLKEFYDIKGRRPGITPPFDKVC